MDERDKEKGTTLPLDRTIMWNLMLQTGDQAKEGSFVGVATVEDLVSKRANITSVNDELQKDIKALEDIVNADMVNIPDAVKEAILSIVNDIIFVATHGKAQMVVHGPGRV